MSSTIDSVVASTSFEINSLSQLESFRDATNSGETFSGKTINLNVNITLSKAWKSISNYYRKTNMDKWFAGEFNGNGHTIYGLTNNGLAFNDINTGYNSSTPAGNTEYVYGLFGSVNGANIHDLKLSNVNIVFNTELLPDGVGALVGYSAGATTIKNIEVNGSISGYDAVGGIVGRARGTSIVIDGCTNNASVNSVRQCGGIAGQLGEFSTLNTEVKNCVNNGAVTTKYIPDSEPKNSPNGYYWAAGIANFNWNPQNTNNKLTITNCQNTGIVGAGDAEYSQSHEIWGTCVAPGNTVAAGFVVITGCTLRNGNSYSYSS